MTIPPAFPARDSFLPSFRREAAFQVYPLARYSAISDRMGGAAVTQSQKEGIKIVLTNNHQKVDII